MIKRLTHAYGAVHATIGCALLVIAGLAVDHVLIQATRQPLPLVWPLAVIQIAVSQIPLRALFEPLEGGAVRGVKARVPRALLALALLTLGLVTYVLQLDSADLATFLILLASIGFAAAATGQDASLWTLGPGMVIVALQFLTPLEPVSHLLVRAPLWLCAGLLGLTATLYVIKETRLRLGLRLAPGPRGEGHPGRTA